MTLVSHADFIFWSGELCVFAVKPVWLALKVLLATVW